MKNNVKATGPKFSVILDAVKVLQDNFKIRAGTIYRRDKKRAMVGEDFEAIQYLVSRGYHYSHD